MSVITDGRFTIKPSQGSFDSRSMYAFKDEVGEEVTLQPGPAQSYDVRPVPVENEDEDDGYVTIAHSGSGLFFTLPEGSEQVVMTDDASGERSWWSIIADPSSTLPDCFTIHNVGRDSYVVPQSTSTGSLVISSDTGYPWSIMKLKQR
ncbi:hypothetical protein [Nocardia sp. NBC_00511]|uniref:hypothetical protein n=1 Tax=Nocardia sp. NBC_00511 TaxID=2903591 RepID=UPI0030E3E465